MRKILFRGKRLDNGEWIEGFPVFDFADCSLKRSGKCVCEHNGELLCFYGWIDELHEYDEVEVIPETICQYTGLTDKNGRKIFEGDIVKINDDVKEAFGISDGSVVYRGGSFIIGDSSGNGTLNSLFAITDINYILRGEVIGNIYDNPELIGDQA